MRRLAFGLMLSAATLVLCASVDAQQPPPGLPSPRVQHVFSTGMKAGTTVEITVTGFDLDEPEKLLFAHPGIKGEVVVEKEPTPDPKDPKKKPGKGRGKKRAAGEHTFKITASSDVPPGIYDLRVVGKWGVSNPRAFAISDQTEVSEKEPNNDVPEAQKVELGTVISGVFSGGTDVDYSSFVGKKGQRIILSCLASSIDSKATPLIEVYDTGGRRLGANRNARDNDALVDVVLPADGEFLVRLCQFTYTGGGPDYFYRLGISTAPWIDAMFPPVVEAGKATQVTLYGRNLPGGQPADGYTADGRPLEKTTVSITPPADATTKITSHGRIEPTIALQDGFAYSLKGPGGSSNPVVIYLARDNLTVKAKPTPSADAAELLSGPGEVTGFLAKRNTKDWVAFNAKKGEKFTIDLDAERVGASGDFYFSVRDGKDPKRDLSGEQDDSNELLHPFGFYNRTTDPGAYTFTAPGDGKYLIAIGCRDTSYLSGPTTAYRLRIGTPQPDFRAVVMPYSRYYQTGSAAWQGGTQSYDVFVHRMDDYAGEIEVAVEGLPAGVKAEPLVIGPAAQWGVLVLTIASDAKPATTPIHVKLTGTAPSGKKLVRTARPASVTWGTPQPNQNIPVIAKLDQSLILAVRAHKAPFSIKADLSKATVKNAMGKDEKVSGPLIVVRQGQKATVPVKVTWAIPEKQNVALTVDSMLQRQQSQPVAAQFAGQPTKDKPEVVLNLDTRSNAVPGHYTLIVHGVAQVPFNRDPKGKQKVNVPADAFSNAISIIVIPNAVVKIAPGNIKNGSLRVGETAELPLKIERLNGFDGVVKLKFEAPKGITGITADDVTLEPGKNEANFILKASSGAKPGNVSNAIVTATAQFAGKYTITQDVKVNFNVAAAPKKNPKPKKK